VAIQPSKPNNRVFLILGVVLAALAFGGVLFAVRQAGGGATTSIVVAKTGITAGSTITSDELTTAAVPQSAAPADAFTDPSTAVGKTIDATVSPNTPIVPALFQSASIPGPATSTTTSNGTTTTAPVSIEAQLTKGFVAMAIPASAVLPQGFTGAQQQNVTAEQVSAGYYIQAGDHIDLLVVDTGSTLGTRYAFQDVPVLRVGVSGSAATGAATVYIVEVARSQSALLAALVTGQGHETVLKYVLRPQSEWGKFTPTGYTPNYESDAGAAFPQVPATTVTTSTLDNLFGH